MASFEAKTFNATDINNGQKYEMGDIVSPNAINAPIEAALLLQALINDINAKIGDIASILSQINEGGLE